ncbi:hypothetical protein B0A49_03861 [Cryomyces minteri]|uniref:Importin N-terminal domain-containing protein n=1 Tax=Cryomyces minteri TaxID=331657 RepID=A0A4U0X4F7_9PEZI|nr:hypothetical protein B0A49_03861 [Cryomyces minteri]
MEEQLVRLLAETQSSQQVPRKQAELQLQQLYNEEAFPIGLASVASHDSVPADIRQSALLALKTFVLGAWTPQFDEFKGRILVSDENKSRLRHMLLELATSGKEERKIKSAASYVISKIASSDFPDEWPDLLPTLLRVIPAGTDSQLHGALKVLSDLVEDCLNEDQFFSVARDLVKVVYDVAVNEARKPTLRALAVSVFRSCFNILEMVMEDHKTEVKGFAEEALNAWTPFFVEVLMSRLPPPPPEDEEIHEGNSADTYRGLIALKLQVVKVLVRIRTLFPATLSPQSPVLFSATWEELSSLQNAYHGMYIEDERQGRLEDADGLPYTLDFLVLEELDFMQACLRAPPVRKELQQQLAAQTSANGSQHSTWVTEVMKLAVAYAQITTEEEGLWDIDVNIFLSEETNVTANYTARTACGDLVIKLGEWLKEATVDGLLTHTRSLYSENTDWKAKEAALYLLNQLLGDFSDVNKQVSASSANGYVDFIRYAMQQGNVFLRARGYLVAGSLIRTSGEALHQVSLSFMEASLQAMTHDSSEVVKVSCIRALQYYLTALPASTTLPVQETIISALAQYLSTQDLSDLNESDDLMVTLVETLRDAIMLDPRVCLTGAGLDLLFTIAGHGANNFQITMLITEIFEDITTKLTAQGIDAFGQLSAKVLPSLTGAFDVGALTEENALTNFAADLLAVLTENASTPLPPGFVATCMPKLYRLLLSSQDDELLKSATSAIRSMLVHDAAQVFAWHDSASNKSGLEVVLVIVDRLLSPTMDDNAAAEVGGLAAEVVEKAGGERLGPYLMQLLRAVAVRLSSATSAQLIQSLILVFARLSLVSAHEVVNFLSQVQVGRESGLQVVMVKWLENSVNFAGYDEIRQNVIALSNIYELNDPRLAQITVKGDLIVPQSNRIITRSRAKQQPVEYTQIPLPLKIVKVLVEELSSAGGQQGAIEAGMAAAEDDEEEVSDDDGSWEDDGDGGFLDLGLGSTKEQLMSFDSPSNNSSFPRGRDDETQAYLLQFFRAASQKPGFNNVFTALSAAEQEKLRSLSSELR